MNHRNLVRYAAAAVLSAGLLLAQGPGTGAATPGQNWRQQHFSRIADLLNLTPDQKTQVQTIFQAAQSQSQTLQPQLRSNRQALIALIKSGATGADFDSKLQPLVNTQSSLMSQMIAIHAKAASQVWALLTPDQQQKAGDLLALMGGMGMGGGMGHRMGMGMHGGPHGGPNQ